LPKKTGFDRANKWNITPRLNISADVPYLILGSLIFAIYGAIYPGVPHRANKN
jgi:hypothetical protein